MSAGFLDTLDRALATHPDLARLAETRSALRLLMLAAEDAVLDPRGHDDWRECLRTACQAAAVTLGEQSQV